MLLTEDQKERVLDEIIPDVDHIVTMPGITEFTRLEMIGAVTGRAIDKITAPVRPSILPMPDDITIGRMAQLEKGLRRKTDMPEARKAEIRDRCLHEFLVEQRNREQYREIQDFEI